MFVCGVDGCKAGWVGTRISTLNSQGEFRVFPDIQALWNAWSDSASVLIDIPIGLIEEGPTPRRCDAEARKLLRRPRSSSIFPVPCRAAVYAPNYAEACAINREKTQMGISKQAWNIVPKIREVDALLNSYPSARQTIRESHPELCFWGLSKGQPLRYYKKIRAGSQERMALLSSLFPRSQQLVNDAIENLTRNLVEPDDIIDAIVLVVTLLLAGDKLESIPSNREWDGTGLPMQMCFLRLK